MNDDRKSGFHWRDGWHFKRQDDGSVRVNYIVGEWLYQSLIIPENEWASIVCSVSSLGETGERWEQSRRFHGIPGTARGPQSTSVDFDKWLDGQQCCCNVSWLDLDERDCPIHNLHIRAAMKRVMNHVSFMVSRAVQSPTSVDARREALEEAAQAVESVMNVQDPRDAVIKRDVLGAIRALASQPAEKEPERKP